MCAKRTAGGGVPSAPLNGGQGTARPTSLSTSLQLYTAKPSLRPLRLCVRYFPPLLPCAAEGGFRVLRGQNRRAFRSSFKSTKSKISHCILTEIWYNNG